MRTDVDNDGYEATAARMLELAVHQPGFLGIESVRNILGITVSYWRDLESMRAWKRNAEHAEARRRGRADWYRQFTTRIAYVEREYSFERE